MSAGLCDCLRLDGAAIEPQKRVAHNPDRWRAIAQRIRGRPICNTCSNECTMKNFGLRLPPSTTRIGLIMTVALLGMLPLRAQAPSDAVVKIRTYYQELMPTIQQA